MYNLPKIDQEFKSLIPPLTPEEREQLEQNIISAKKCHDAIVLWDGIIVDGHNRFEICEKHGIEFEVVDLPLETREDVKVWILENQLARRNINDATRIDIALRKKELLKKKAKLNQSRPRGKKGSSKVSKPDFKEIDVQKILATEADVSVGTFNRYTQLLKKAPPDLLAQVKSGKLKIGTAHRIMETKKHLHNAGKKYEYIADVLAASSKEDAHTIYVGLKQLLQTLSELIQKLQKGGQNDQSQN